MRKCTWPPLRPLCALPMHTTLKNYGYEITDRGVAYVARALSPKKLVVGIRYWASCNRGYYNQVSRGPVGLGERMWNTAGSESDTQSCTVMK